MHPYKLPPFFDKHFIRYCRVMFGNPPAGATFTPATRVKAGAEHRKLQQDYDALMGTRTHLISIRDASTDKEFRVDVQKDVLKNLEKIRAIIPKLVASAGKWHDIHKYWNGYSGYDLASVSSKDDT